MKPILHYPVILWLLLGPVSWVNAQHRTIYLKLKSIETDTVRKQILFRYRLGNIAPKDRLRIELLDSTRAPFRLESVYGDIGTILSDGKNKTVYWNPVADRQKVENRPVTIQFVVTTVPGQGLTRWQMINLGRWVIGGGLAAYTLWEGVSIVNAVNRYNKEDQPTSLFEKNIASDERTGLLNRQRAFYRVAAVSAAALLANITLSMMQSRFKLKPAKLAVTGSTNSVGLAYTL